MSIVRETPDSIDKERQPHEMGGGGASLALFALIAAMLAMDLTIEFRAGNSITLQSFELGIFLLALAGIGLHGSQIMTARHRSRRLGTEPAQARVDVLQWSPDARRWNLEAQHLLQGLGEAIDRQFERWGLTPAEREVAVLQLKGLRHRAIAQLRNTSEQAARQQALAVYRKSGLTGRSDLAAFFLQDLFLPTVKTAEMDPVVLH